VTNVAQIKSKWNSIELLGVQK